MEEVQGCGDLIRYDGHLICDRRGMRTVGLGAKTETKDGGKWTGAAELEALEYGLASGLLPPGCKM